MDYMDDYMEGGLGAALSDPSIAGPLIGGGAAQVGALATRLLLKNKPNITKWAPTIGLAIGGGISAALIFSPRHRQTGIAGLLTAALVALPRQIEDLMLPAGGTMQDYLGLTTAEAEMSGYGGNSFGAPDVQLLDSGSGSTGVLGTIVPEREMAGSDGFGAGSEDIQMLAGFGSNFLASQ